MILNDMIIFKYIILVYFRLNLSTFHEINKHKEMNY